ncbi:MAG TPA: glycosyltransferase family 39 protein [Anaerolineales bacterium]|nr:glycosyltransferase family 39 protein [Anaerolineales bacterium]
MKNNKSLWRWFCSFAALEAGAALLVLFFVPHEGGSFSIIRLALFGILLAFLILWIYFLARPPTRLDSFVRPSLAQVSALLAVILGWSLYFLRYLDPQRLLPYYQRLGPIVLYLLVVALQFSIFILVSLYGFHRQNLLQLRPVYKLSIVAFCVLLFVLCLSAITHLGFTKDPAYWGEPGVPLLGWQVVAVILFGIAVLILGLRWFLDRSKQTSLRTDLLFAIVIWLAAISIWLSVPMSVMQNSFYAPMIPPSNQPFPNSDAAYYDYHAQSLLLGMGYLGDIPTRPLYILFLALLHILFGQNYVWIITAQSCVLALFPVTLYFLAKKIHSRAAGVMVASFAIFRELTTLWVSSATRVSDTRTLLTDLPTTLMVMLACLFVMRWLEKKSVQRALVAGGMFGVMLLLRTQSIIILPLVLLLTLFVFQPEWREAGKMIALFIVGVAVTVAPWLIHNYLSIGQFTFDDPRQLAVISSQYALSGNLDTSQFNIQSQSLAGNLLTFTLKHPEVVSWFVANHFLATEIGGLLALPLIEPFKSLRAPIDIYWFGWDGHLDWYNFLLLVLYLAVIAIGLGAAWRRLRWLGLAPLVFSLGYALANGIGRFSGWRYDLPADWISFFYFGIGTAEVLATIALLLGAQTQRLFTAAKTERNRGKLNLQLALPMLAGFILIGSLPWIAEHALPPQLLQPPETAIIEQASHVPALQTENVTPNQLSHFLAENTKAEVFHGRLLYPRFFWRGQGIAQAHPSPAYVSRDYSRLGFLLMTNQVVPFVFPSKILPSNFPDTGDVIVFSCKQLDYSEARVIIFPRQNLVFQAESPLRPCTDADE